MEGQAYHCCLHEEALLPVKVLRRLVKVGQNVSETEPLVVGLQLGHFGGIQIGRRLTSLEREQSCKV